MKFFVTILTIITLNSNVVFASTSRKIEKYDLCYWPILNSIIHAQNTDNIIVDPQIKSIKKRLHKYSVYVQLESVDFPDVWPSHLEYEVKTKIISGECRVDKIILIDDYL